MKTVVLYLSEESHFKQTDIGLIPKDWGIQEIENITTRVCVGFVGSCFEDYCDKENGVPMVRTTNLSDQGLIFSDLKYVTKEFHAKNKKSQLTKGDIVVARHGDSGKACYYDANFESNCLNVVVIRPDRNRCSPRFLLHSFKNPIVKSQIEASIVGSVQGVLNTKIIARIKIPLPKMAEQEKISAIIDSFCQKIENNNDMNKTLEAVGRSVFKRWFVDFEFPNEEGEPYKSSGGEMVHNEALDEEIPKKWNVKPIDEIADFLNGLALQKFPARSGEEFLPVVKIRELRQGITESSDKANLDVPKAYIVNDGDILFSWSGSLEVVIWGFGKGALNQHLFKVTSSKYPKWFFYYWIVHYLPEYRQIAAGKATTMGHIQRHHLSASQVTIPDSMALERMGRVLTPILERISRIKKETRILSEIRDSLLPKLMSGKIRVSVPKDSVEPD